MLRFALLCSLCLLAVSLGLSDYALAEGAQIDGNGLFGRGR